MTNFYFFPRLRQNLKYQLFMNDMNDVDLTNVQLYDDYFIFN